MKIAIPSDGRTLESKVNPTFGRTEYFIVADTKTMNFDIIDNKAAAAQGGAGILAAQTIVDSGAEAVVTFLAGQNAADVLTAAGIKIYKAESGTVKEMIEKFNRGELNELRDIHPGYHHHG